MAKRSNPKRIIRAAWGGAKVEDARHFLEHPTTERVLAGLIILNAVVLGLETSPSIMARHGWWLDPADNFLLGIFVVEVLVRLIVTGRGFFRDPWSVFDFIVITLSLMQRFASRQPESFANKLIAALRNQFGGHAVKKAE